MQIRQQRTQHDRSGQGQSGHALAVSEVLRVSAVCTAAPIHEAGLSPRQGGSEVGTQGGSLVLSEQRQQPLA